MRYSQEHLPILSARVQRVNSFDFIPLFLNSPLLPPEGNNQAILAGPFFSPGGVQELENGEKATCQEASLKRVFVDCEVKDLKL